MSQNARILAALADRDDWVTTRDLYDLAGGYIGALHSRISELRTQGHTIESRKVPGKTGAAGHEYRLVGTLGRDGGQTFACRVGLTAPPSRPSASPPSLTPPGEALALASGQLDLFGAAA